MVRSSCFGMKVSILKLVVVEECSQASAGTCINLNAIEDLKIRAVLHSPLLI